MTSLSPVSLRPPCPRLSSLATLEGVPSAFAAARDGIDALLRDRGLRRTPPETTAESLLRGAHASAVLEGSASSLDEVRAGDRRRRGPGRRSGSRPSCCRWGPTLTRSPLQALARLHTVAGARSLPDEQLGRPRDADVGRPAARGGRRAVRRRRRRRRCWSPRWPTPSCSRRRRSPRTTGSSPAPPSGWCSSPAASTRSRWWCPRPGHLATARGVRVEPAAAYRDGGPAGRPRVAALRRRGVRRGAEASPLTDA